MVQLAVRIQKYVAFDGQILGELVGDDEVRFDEVRVRVTGCISQGLQSLVRFRRRHCPCEQHQVVPGSTQSLEEPNGFTSRIGHEPGIGGAVSCAWPGAEIMPAKNTGVRFVKTRQEAVVFRDDGAMAVADVQLCHGSAHSLLHHFLAGQNPGQFLPDRLRERKMRFLAQRDPVQMV